MDELKRMRLRGLAERGLSSLADEVEIDLPQLSRIIAGKTPCSLKRAVTLCYVTNRMAKAVNQSPDFTLQDFKADAEGETLKPDHKFWVTEVLFKGAAGFTAGEILERPEFKTNKDLMLALHHALNTDKTGHSWGSWLISLSSSHKPWFSEES